MLEASAPDGKQDMRVPNVRVKADVAPPLGGVDSSVPLVLAAFASGEGTHDHGRHDLRSLLLALLSGGGEMSTLTIRQLDERTHAGLRGRAAEHGRSVEAEVRAILDAAVNRPERNFLLSLHAAMAEVGGMDLEVASRTEQARPVDLS